MGLSDESMLWMHRARTSYLTPDSRLHLKQTPGSSLHNALGSAPYVLFKAHGSQSGSEHHKTDQCPDGTSQVPLSHSAKRAVYWRRTMPLKIYWKPSRIFPSSCSKKSCYLQRVTAELAESSLTQYTFVVPVVLASMGIILKLEHSIVQLWLEGQFFEFKIGQQMSSLSPSPYVNEISIETLTADNV